MKAPGLRMFLLLLFAFCFSMPGKGGALSEQGQAFVVSGAVTDKSTRAPLAKVRASVQDTQLSTETDGLGKYRFNDLPPGEQYLLFEKDGYVPCLVKVRAAGDEREITVDAALEAIHQEITVTAEAFLRTETAASSRRSLAGAEIRNIPGTFEDVSRALQVIPGVATSGDFKNDLIVRGGSPAENLFVIDRVQVPGLSHFGSQNSSGGSFGLLDAGLIQDIDFYSGGSIIPSFFGSKLLSAGTGYARGFEISVQKSLTEKFSWVFDYSYSIVKYKAMDGVLRPGDFDYRHILNAVVMVKASPTWELSLKWRYTGGQPYTPFDLQLSEAKDAAYFDLTRINTLRYPAYHRLDVRVEKRFAFRRWHLDLYLDVQNLYNRKNVYFKFWEDGQQKTIYFLPIIPFIGIQAGF